MEGRRGWRVLKNYLLSPRSNYQPWQMRAIFNKDEQVHKSHEPSRWARCRPKNVPWCGPPKLLFGNRADSGCQAGTKHPHLLLQKQVPACTHDQMHSLFEQNLRVLVSRLEQSRKVRASVPDSRAELCESIQKVLSASR